MSGNTRFCTANRVFGATVKNGSGGGAPALVQDSAYPMSNIALNDRLVQWSTGASPSNPTTVDIDLGNTYTLDTFSMHGIRISGGTNFTGCDVYVQTGTYAPGGSWTVVGTIPGSALNAYRDAGLHLANSVSARSVRFVFAHFGHQWAVGKFFAGLMTDLGIVADAGSENSPQRNVTLYTFPSGTTIELHTGDNGRKISLMFTNVLKATRDAILNALPGAGDPFVYMDEEDRFWDCICADKVVACKRLSPTTFQVTLNLTALP